MNLKKIKNPKHVRLNLSAQCNMYMYQIRSIFGDKHAKRIGIKMKIITAS